MSGRIEQSLDHVRVRGEDARLGVTRIRGLLAAVVCALLFIGAAFAWPGEPPDPPTVERCAVQPHHPPCTTVRSPVLRSLPEPDLLRSLRLTCMLDHPTVQQACAPQPSPLLGWTSWERMALGDDREWARALASERRWGAVETHELLAAVAQADPPLSAEFASSLELVRDEVGRLEQVRRRVEEARVAEAHGVWEETTAAEQGWWALTVVLWVLSGAAGLLALLQAILLFQRTGGVNVDVLPHQLRIDDETWPSHDLVGVEVTMHDVRISTADGRLHVRPVFLSSTGAEVVDEAVQVLVARAEQPEDPQARRALESVLGRSQDAE